MKAGASDFLVKDRLFRLAPVVEREVAEARGPPRAGPRLEQKQRELLQAQKMEAVGRLAGGVAHDFNNLLSRDPGLRPHAGAPAARGPAAAPPRGRDHPRRGARRPLTRQLLRFSRKEVPEPRVLDLNAVVAGSPPCCGRVIGEDDRARRPLAARLAPVRADPGQLEQVILNLAVNARDAMPDGGRLVLRPRRPLRRDGRGAAVRLTWPTPAPASRPRSAPTSSSRSSPPRRPARAPASAWPPSTAS